MSHKQFKHNDAVKTLFGKMLDLPGRTDFNVSYIFLLTTKKGHVAWKYNAWFDTCHKQVQDISDFIRILGFKTGFIG